MIVGYAKSGSSVRNPCDRQKNRKRSRGPCSLQDRTSIPRTRESLSKNHSRIYIYYFFFFCISCHFCKFFRDLPLVLSFSLSLLFLASKNFRFTHSPMKVHTSLSHLISSLSLSLYLFPPILFFFQ